MEKLCILPKAHPNVPGPAELSVICHLCTSLPPQQIPFCYPESENPSQGSAAASEQSLESTWLTRAATLCLLCCKTLQVAKQEDIGILRSPPLQTDPIHPRLTEPGRSPSVTQAGVRLHPSNLNLQGCQKKIRNIV